MLPRVVAVGQMYAIIGWRVVVIVFVRVFATRGGECNGFGDETGGKFVVAAAVTRAIIWIWYRMYRTC